VTRRSEVTLLAPGDARAVLDAAMTATDETPERLLGDFAGEWGCRFPSKADEALRGKPLRELAVRIVPLPPEQITETKPAPPAFATQPLTADGVVRMAYALEIHQVASFLRAGLSVLVRCDKLVAERLGAATITCANLKGVRIDAVAPAEPGPFGGGGSRAQRQMAAITKAVADLKDGEVLFLPHLDLLVGGGSGLSNEAREVAETLYAAHPRGSNDEALILACVDPSLDVPEVIAARFAARVQALGVPKTVLTQPGDVERTLGAAMMTEEQAARFRNFDPASLYKNVAGMNPIRLMDAIAYAVAAHAEGPPAPPDALFRSIRQFKAQTSVSFDIPNVGFDEIGGYNHVKTELLSALRLMTENFDLLPDQELQKELIPRGFLFHGPPGTGKTLFAKAVANKINATILVVSGPEVTDMYVGESERKVRDLFAEARRNAPSVLVFDEFDAIAAKRTGRDDGGSRAGNAVVAQILTEMDGFRPDVPILVIGTTNQIGLIDPALLRPSRFRAIEIELPDAAARRAIAAVHAGKFGIACSPGLLDAITNATESFNGDDIRAVFRDACVEHHVQKKPITPFLLGRIVGLAQHAKNRLRGAADAGRQYGGGRPGDRDANVTIVADRPEAAGDTGGEHVDVA
jgi:transitional endoplasmic reticulum ATPase